jgi:hypothetical protein
MTTTSSSYSRNNNNNNTNEQKARQHKMYMIKELNDIIRFTKSEEIRKDLVFTRDKLLDSLYEEEPVAVVVTAEEIALSSHDS